MDIGQDKSLYFEYGRRMLKDVIRFTKESKKFGSHKESNPRPSDSVLQYSVSGLLKTLSWVRPATR